MWKKSVSRYCKWILAGFILGIMAACNPQVSFQVTRPPKLQIDDIKYLAVGNFRNDSGTIPLPTLRPDESIVSMFKLEGWKLLNPPLQGFSSISEQSRLSADLFRIQMLNLFSANSPWKLINTTGKERGFSGNIPDDAQVAVLEGRVRYAEVRHEGRELLNYVVSVENKGISFQEQMLAKASSLGAESLGAGFEIPTPYVELMAAIEIELSLKRRSGGLLLPPQTHRAYYVRKWGGSGASSHIPWKIRDQIIQDFQQDETLYQTIFSDLERTKLALEDPEAYLAKGLNLKRDPQVPLTSLDLMIRLSRHAAVSYLKQISPYQENADLDIMPGDKVAVTLIQGNAYQEAIAYLQGLNKLSPEDEYNLGLAYEANGEFDSARNHYKISLKQKPENALILESLIRLKR